MKFPKHPSNAAAANFLCRTKLVVLFMLLAGCGATLVNVDTKLPPPLTMRQPPVIGLHIPQEFIEYTYKEKRYGSKWEVRLGPAQTRALTTLLESMFEQVVALHDLNAAQSDPRIRVVVEPAVDEYSFITPRDAGSPVFAVSVKYRLNIYTAEGKLADSWAFTGYGSVPSGGSFDSDEPLKHATELAMRDAGAKLVAEFREQAAMRDAVQASDAANSEPKSQNTKVDDVAADIPPAPKTE